MWENGKRHSTDQNCRGCQGGNALTLQSAWNKIGPNGKTGNVNGKEQQLNSAQPVGQPFVNPPLYASPPTP
eukprot:4170433-Alexandrium_andersonii.AAC.1